MTRINTLTFEKYARFAVNHQNPLRSEDLKRAVAYVRVGNDPWSHDSEGQRATLKNLVRERSIEVVHWNNDPTSVNELPFDQRVFQKEILTMQQHGAARLLVQSWDRISPDEHFLTQMLNQASQCGVIVMAGDGTSNYADYVKKMARNELDAIRREALKEIDAERASKDEAPISETMWQVLDLIGDWMPTEKKRDFVKQIMKLNQAKIPFVKMPQMLAQEGFRNRKGSPWSDATIRKIVKILDPGSFRKFRIR